MTWNPNNSWSVALAGTVLQPKDVYYEYGGPLLFSSSLGLFDALCYKLDEIENHDLYLICKSDPAAVAAMCDGRLSVRGALDATDYWIIETTQDQRITRTWQIAPHELPVDFLPKKNNGLHAYFGQTPDTLEQSEGFFSVKFSGPGLVEGSISFRNFKGMVDRVYDVVNRVFTPSVLMNRQRAGVFDFDIAEPKLASLLIAVKQPLLDVDALHRRLKTDDTNIEAAIADEIEENRGTFFDGVGEIVGAAALGTIPKSLRSRQFTWLETISELAPDVGAAYDMVEIAANTHSGYRSLVISEATGSRIHDAHRLALTEEVILTGVIVEVNSPSCTFIIRDPAFRQTTCVLKDEVFRRFERNGELKVGAKVAVAGVFQKRSRRDKLIVKDEPRFAG